jgi:1,4-dihydroxy-2-naphthoyl-CoA hydrolase
MSIWFKPTTIEYLENYLFVRKTISESIGIKFTEIGDDYLKGTMPVDERTHQPAGILHGGASCVLAESLGSVAAYMVVDSSKQYVVGLDIHTTHIRSISHGLVTGIAKPIHLGRSTQVWSIDIVNEEGKLISVTRLNMFVKDHVKREA